MICHPTIPQSRGTGNVEKSPDRIFVSKILLFDWNPIVACVAHVLVENIVATIRDRDRSGGVSAHIVSLIIERDVCLAIERFFHRVFRVVDGLNKLVDHVVFLFALLLRVGDTDLVRLVVEGDACLPCN